MVLRPPLWEPGEHKTVLRQNKETLKEIWERAAKAEGLSVDVWTVYDEEEARERAEGRKEKEDEWGKKERFFCFGWGSFDELL